MCIRNISVRTRAVIEQNKSTETDSMTFPPFPPVSQTDRLYIDNSFDIIMIRAKDDTPAELTA